MSKYAKKKKANTNKLCKKKASSTSQWFFQQRKSYTVFVLPSNKQNIQWSAMTLAKVSVHIAAIYVES